MWLRGAVRGRRIGRDERRDCGPSLLAEFLQACSKGGNDSDKPSSIGQELSELDRCCGDDEALRPPLSALPGQGHDMAGCVYLKRNRLQHAVHRFSTCR